MWDTAFVTAGAGVFGSLVGATASIATTWITQRTQVIRANAEWRVREREALYKDFIAEASRLTLDALTHSLERPDQIMSLYSVLSRIRLMSGRDVVRQGEACCRRIIDLYGQPNLTTDQIRMLIVGSKIDELDPLKEFSSACRKELLAGHARPVAT